MRIHWGIAAIAGIILLAVGYYMGKQSKNGGIGFNAGVNTGVQGGVQSSNGSTQMGAAA